MITDNKIRKVKEWVANKEHQFTPERRNISMSVITARRISDGTMFERSAPITIVDKVHTHSYKCSISTFDKDCIHVHVRVCERHAGMIVDVIRTPIDSIQNN